MVEFKPEILDRWQADLPELANRIAFGLGEQVIADVQANWSATSPAAVGTPPAVVTGELAQSITVQMVGEGAAQVGSVSPHATRLEYGTTQMAPKALQQMTDELKE